MSSAGPSSPTAVDGNCHFGFNDHPSLSSHVIEEHQGFGLFQETPGTGAQELPVEGEPEPFEGNQFPQESPVETSQPCEEVAEEVSQPCQDNPEEVSQPCKENYDDVNQTCQEVPQISQPCQNASYLCSKVSEEACELCQENPEKVYQKCQGVPVEVGRLVHQPGDVGGIAQEILVEADKPTQEISEEFSQPCQEFSVEVGRLAQEASAINLLSQDIPEVDKPSQVFPWEGLCRSRRSQRR